MYSNKKAPIKLDHPDNGGEYIFYDFETYMDVGTYDTIPYAMSYVVVKNNNIIESNVLLKDTIVDDLCRKIFDTFSRYIEGKRDIWLVGFNNGSFDDYLLIKILSKYTNSLWKTMIDSNNRILQFKWGCLQSKDLFRFLNTSLANALKSFGCQINKDELDHKEIQLAVERGEFTDYISKNRYKIIEYARKDVEGLSELYFKVRDTFLSIDPMMDINNYMTLSQMSMDAFQRKFGEEYKAKFNPIVLDKKMDDYVRQALVGGKTRNYKLSDMTDNSRCENVVGVDCTSLYPFSMMSNEFAYVEKTLDQNKNMMIDTDVLEPTNNYVVGQRGFYKIWVKKQPEDHIYPKRKDDLTWDWEFDGEFETYTDHIKLAYFIESGGEYRFLEGYRFKDKVKWGSIFERYMNDIKTMKIEQDRFKIIGSSNYNPVLRECLKLLLNSLSGKMVQKPISKESHLVSSKLELQRLESAYKPSFIPIDSNLFLVEVTIPDDKIKIKSSASNGIFIYSYSQVHMHKQLLSKISNEYKHTTDTDSLFFCKSQEHRVQDIIGDDFGQFKYETRDDRQYQGYFPAKKIYTVYTRDKEICKYKFKGVKAKDYLVPDELVDEIRDLIEKKKFAQVNSISVNLHTFNQDIETMKMLCGKSKVYILCYQIRRKIKDVKITGMYMLKEFQLNGNHLDTL
jgi:hypothetical protein